MRIERIVFLQGDEADEALKFYNEVSDEATFEFLRQWHYPGEHETHNEPSAGRVDDVHMFPLADGSGTYVMNVNTNLGYIGLEFHKA